MNNTQKALLALAIAISVFSVVFVAVKSAQTPTQAVQPTVQLGSAFALNAKYFPSGDISTTTRQYLNSTTMAKSSFVVPTDEADLIDLNILAEASSTSAVLLWDVSFSNNYVPSTGNGDWYCGTASSVAIATTTFNGTTCHENQWTVGTVSTSTMNTAITPNAEKYMRVRFYSKTGDISMHAEAAVRKPLAR